MDTKVLCKWLELPNWPPDHYALLGLKPGEGDSTRLESQVHERMARLRRYQITHPEEATEGMNRLAQAFICVSEALAKVPCSKCPPSAKKSLDDTSTNLVADTRPDLDWQKTPPPVRGAAVKAQLTPPPKTHALVAQPAGPRDLAETSKIQVIEDLLQARRGLSTLSAVIARIHLTRRLTHAWRRVGRYLKAADRRLRAAEEADLSRRLNQIFELMGEFPPIFGHPGKPGYRVVAMARLEMTAPMFRMLDESQRTCLASDWLAGFGVLLAYRRFLRAEFRRLRQGGVKGLIQSVAGKVAWIVGAVLVAAGACVLVYLAILLIRLLV